MKFGQDAYEAIAHDRHYGGNTGYGDKAARKAKRFYQQRKLEAGVKQATITFSGVFMLFGAMQAVGYAREQDVVGGVTQATQNFFETNGDTVEVVLSSSAYLAVAAVLLFGLKKTWDFVVPKSQNQGKKYSDMTLLEKAALARGEIV